MKLVTSAEMRRLEEAANRAGVSYDTMMENAGRSVAELIRARRPDPDAKVLVLVGPGNNGGDGLVAARHLHAWGYAVRVYVWRRGASPDALAERAQAVGVPLAWSRDDPGLGHLAEAVRHCDVLVDALLGTGATGPLRGDLPELLACVHAALEARRPSETLHQVIQTAATPRRTTPLMVAVDLPSGLNADTGACVSETLPADVTVTFACAKRGQMTPSGAGVVGELVISDIGIATDNGGDAELAVAAEVARKLPPRPADGHKGFFGKALIVAGSTPYVGAPCLAAEAAYRCGAGLVTLAVPGAIYGIVAAKVTESTFLVLPNSMGALVPEANQVLCERLGNYDALLVGPGLGTEKVTGEFLRELLCGSHRGHKRLGFGLPERGAATQPTLPPLVMDADGLSLLAQMEDWPTLLPAGTVLTPHPGEMARLTGRSITDIEADRLGAARTAARAWGCHVVLKGAFTVVAAPQGPTTVLPFANPTLATAGTGDVLAGAVVSLLAQGLTPYDAAVCAAYLHGLAGELARGRFGSAGMLASDLMPLLPEAIKILHSEL
jgi:NAD(P)H-hydrate epimerase